MNNTVIKPKRTEAEKLFAALNKPSLHALSYALRHPDTWPEGFVWDFTVCDRCAMGLAHQLWRSIPQGTRSTGPSIMARQFAMPYGEASRIFLGDLDWTPKEDIVQRRWFRAAKRLTRSDFSKVTPEMVADQIDAYLARAE